MTDPTKPSTLFEQTNATPTNRGVSKYYSQTFDVHPARFDYYRCTIEEKNPDAVYEILSPIFDRESRYPIRSRNLQTNYQFTDEIVTTDGSIQFFYGGYCGVTYGVNVCGKGRISEELATTLQSSQLEFSVSRADVCQDFIGDFAVTRLKIIEHCNRSRMKSHDKGACPESTVAEGRTVECGGKHSAYQVICYEKGIQLGKTFPRNLLRLEHRFQPKSRMKRIYSRLTPTEMIGTHQGAITISENLLGSNVEPYLLDVRTRQKDPLASLVSQYRRPLSAVFDQHGACGGGELLWSLVQQATPQGRAPL